MTPETIRARAIVAAGHAAVWQGDFRALRPMIDEAVSVLRTGREAASAWMLLGTSFAFAENDPEGAQHAFARAEDIARKNARDIALSLTLYWSGLAAQLRGDLKSARAKFEEALEVGESTANPPAIAHPLTVLGHLALRERKLDEALAAFRRALDIFTQIDDRWGLTQVVEGIGLALLDTRDAETGTRLLAAASAAWLHMGASPGRQEESEREKDERIREALGSDRLRIVLASGAAMSYEQMVALAQERIEQTAAAPLIRVRALGPVEVRRGDQVIDTGSQRELLLFLLVHPNGATKEQIGAALWPDADPAKLRNNFHVSVHRLRKALGGNEWVIVEGETYAVKPGIDFDAATFERDANAALRAKDAARLARAIDLYRGDFFANATSGEWHLELRDRLRELYAKALGALARITKDTEVWQKLVELDTLDEEAARNLMSAMIERGDTAGANRVYRRLVDALRKELDVEPEPETVAVATKAKRK